jgi:hypothetical protein
MERILVYEALDGSLCRSKRDAVLSSLQHLGENACGQVMGYRVADALIKNRTKVIELLTSLEEQTT